LGIETYHIVRFPEAHPKAASLAHRVGIKSLMAAHHSTVHGHDLSRWERKIPEKVPIVSFDETDLLAFRSSEVKESDADGLPDDLLLEVIPERENYPRKGLLRELVQEIALVPPAVAAPVKEIAGQPLVINHPDVVSGSQFFRPPGKDIPEEQTKLDLPVTDHTGIRGKP